MSWLTNFLHLVFLIGWISNFVFWYLSNENLTEDERIWMIFVGIFYTIVLIIGPDSQQLYNFNYCYFIFTTFERVIDRKEIFIKERNIEKREYFG